MRALYFIATWLCIFVLLASCASSKKVGELYILYTTTGKSGEQIRLLKPDGSMNRLLVEVKGLYTSFPFSPLVSPDGRKILYTVWLSAEDRAEFWIMNIDGTGQTPIFQGSEPRHPEWPSWSGDGTKVAFTTRWDKDKSVCSLEFYVVDLATGDLTKLPMTGWRYQWSPVDSRMAILCAYGEKDGIYIIDVDTGAEKKLLTEIQLDLYFVWSPDGKSIAFAYQRSIQEGPGVEISLLDVDSGNFRKIIRARAFYCPSWSPQGDKILFTTLDHSLFVLDLDKGEAMKFAEGIAWDCPVWSPDGEEIAFISIADPKYGHYGQIYKLSLATGEIIQLTDDPKPKFSLSWVAVPGTSP